MLRINHVWVIFITIFLFFCSCSNNDNDKTLFTIKGSLSNLNAPYFYIAMEKFDSIVVDTVWIDKQGNFLYRGNVDTLTITSLYFDKQLWSTSVFLDKGWNVEIKGDANTPDLIRVNGGAVNDDLTAFKKANTQLFESRIEIIHKIDSTTNSEIRQTYVNNLKNINFDLKNAAKEYIEKNPEKIASVVLIQDFYKDNTSIEQLDEVLSLLKGMAQSFYLADDLRKYNDNVKLSQVGSYAPNFKLKNGKKEFEISKYKGKYLYLTFAAQNGDIYTNSIPAMIESYKKLKNKNVEFISVMIDYASEQVLDSIKWPVFFEKKAWASKEVGLYNIKELPYSLLISPEGLILERGIAVSALSEKIDELQKLKTGK